MKSPRELLKSRPYSETLRPLIRLGTGLIRLRELAHCTVDGKDRGSIRLPRLPLYLFSHYEPPHSCYTGLPLLTATKSSDSGPVRPCWHTRDPFAYLISAKPRDLCSVQFARSNERDRPMPHRGGPALSLEDRLPEGFWAFAECFQADGRTWPGAPSVS